MTFLEAALEILRREGRPLHYKELTERALGKKLLTFVGRTPEVTMQTQLTAAVKKAPGNPFVRVKPGVFGLLRYPELSAEEREAIAKSEAKTEPRAPARERERERARSSNGEPAPAGEDSGGEAGRRRRRRRGRGRGPERGAPAAAAGAAGGELVEEAETEEPMHGGLSAEARAAALAESGILEHEDEPAGDEEEAAPNGESHGESMAEDTRETDQEAGARLPAHERDADGALGERAGLGAGAAEGDELEAEDDLEGEDEAGAGPEQAEAGAGGEARPGDELGPGRRRRRRRRRGRGGEGETFGGSETSRFGGGGASGAAPGGGEAAGGFEGGSAGGSGAAAGGGEAGALAPGGGEEGAATGGGPAPSVEAQGPRRISTPVDAALEILRGQAPGRGVHVRQIADAAARRRLVHGEPNEAWRVMRTALAAEPRERLRAGLRPRVRSAGAGLFALARRPPDAELERAEQVFGEARRALRERTLAGLERRIAELPAAAFEALGRVLLQREGFGPATFVKRVEGTIYVEAMRGRGSRPSKCLIGLRFGPTSAGVRSIGELRAGIAARNQDEGLLMLAGRLADDAIGKWKQPGPPVEIADGPALAETCVRHGVGVINTMVSVDFVDADFFAEISEG